MAAAPQPDPPEGGTLAGRYLEFLATQRRYSPHTVAAYRADLGDLAPLEATVGLPSVTPRHIRKLASTLHASGLGARSIARRLSAWRGFFAWLATQLPLKCNPVDGVKAPKRAKGLPKALSPDDAVRLVEGGGSPGLGHDRGRGEDDAKAQAVAACNRAMFELLYSSGLRVSELSALDIRRVGQSRRTGTAARATEGATPGWLDFEAREVTVTGKGGKMRTVPVGKPALAAVADWLALRPLLCRGGDGAGGVGGGDALFLSLRGSRISPRVLQLRLRAHAQALEMPAKVHPHVLRHSFASHLLQSSGDLRAVQEMLGHSSIASTQVYTALDFQHLARVYDAAHPRAKAGRGGGGGNSGGTGGGTGGGT